MLIWIICATLNARVHTSKIAVKSVKIRFWIQHLLFDRVSSLTYKMTQIKLFCIHGTIMFFESDTQGDQGV